MNYKMMGRFIAQILSVEGIFMVPALIMALCLGETMALRGFLVDSSTPNCGIALKDLKLKANVLLVSITRAGHTEIPNGMSSFMPGDYIVVVANSQQAIHSMDDIFA